MRVTSMGIVLRCSERSDSFVYHGGNKGKVICAGSGTSKRRDSAMMGAGRVVKRMACKMWIDDRIGKV